MYARGGDVKAQPHLTLERITFLPADLDFARCRDQRVDQVDAEFGQMAVAERESMLAGRDQIRVRREVEANRADAFAHLAPRRELATSRPERRAPPVHFERDLLHHAPRISLLLQRRNLPVAVCVNHREDAVGHPRTGGQTQLDAHPVGRECDLRGL